MSFVTHIFCHNSLGCCLLMDRSEIGSLFMICTRQSFVVVAAAVFAVSVSLYSLLLYIIIIIIIIYL